VLVAAGGGDGTPLGEAADTVDAYPGAWGFAECVAECEAYWGCGGVVEDETGVTAVECYTRLYVVYDTANYN
jgi:hypothetical protein